MRCEKRKVDKSGLVARQKHPRCSAMQPGCISFNAKKYEAGVLYAGQTVNVIYDPADTTTLTIEHERSGDSFQVRELVIGVHTGPRPKLPKTMTASIPETSRLLDEKGKIYQERRNAVRRAISYKDIVNEEKDGEANV